MYKTKPGKTQNVTEQARKLREQAEQLFRTETARLSTDVEKLSKADMISLNHELQVHQIELQLQNDELQRTQRDLEASQTKYFELYNLAPVGYITMSEKGIITEANLTFSKLVGYARQYLLKKQFTTFIYPEDQDIFYKFKKLAQNTDKMESCELRLVAQDGVPFWVELETNCTYDITIKENFCHEKP
jgi:two-component system cell cycle sensor histidine kinase/response regulator CckA